MSTPPRTANVRELSFNERKAFALSVSQDGRHHQMGPWSQLPHDIVPDGVYTKCLKCGCGLFVFGDSRDHEHPVTGTALQQDCRG